MRQSQETLEAIDISSYRRYLQQMLIAIGVLLLSLVSGSAFAIEANPGSSLTCPANSTKGFLSNGSYSSLVTSFTSNNYQTVVSQSTASGGTTVSIPLKIKMSVTSSGESAANSTPALYGSSPQAISFVGDPSSRTPSTAITLEFQNSSNNQTVFLDKVAMSAFDIDKSVNNGSWDDNVKITGITQSGAPITGTFQNIPNSRVIGGSSGLRLPSTPDDDNCTLALQSNCQGSVVFDEPVKSVTLVYTDLKSNRTITSRRFEFRLDSYCYKPTPAYSITKTDGVDSIGTNNITSYTIKVANIGEVALSNIVLKDPAATGLTKSDDISCDSTDNANVCSSSTTPPTKAELEGSGFNISSLPVGRSYTINVPTRVTASEGSTVTNTATIKAFGLDEKQASDTNSVTSLFSGGSTATSATCPANHKMYYIGSSTAPSHSPMATPKNLTWTSGSLEDAFIFSNNESSGNKIFNFRFTATDLSSSQNNRRPPFFGDISGTTANAINFVHSSPAVKENHSINLKVNRPVSRIGYKIQDLDSFGTGTSLAYSEQATAFNSGVLTSFPNFHTILQNSNETTVTAIDGANCGLNGCTIDATWNYTLANNEISLVHRNSKTSTNSDHAVGYSDFYFCLAPPKVVVKKVLTGNRVNDAESQRDQFNIKVSGDSLTPDTAGSPASFTTGGSGSTISNATSSVLTLAPTTSYTIAERVLTGTNEGSNNNYKASYECTNATTDSKTIMPKGDGYSFSLSNLDYGDEITCTITNTPSVYTFTGFVFNDNGGIIASEQNKLDTISDFTSNANYFNGIFNNSGSNKESGIGASALQVRLTNCGPNGGTNIAGTMAQDIPETATSGLLLGQYKFTVPINVIAALSSQKVCVVQVEPSNWEYSVDTTPNAREITLVNGLLDYKTESNGSRNLDFGEVKANNAPLVLEKAQYVHNCDTSLNYTGTKINEKTDDPKVGFSIKEVTDVGADQCISYRIIAYNRGHIELKEIRITDPLQSIKSKFFNPLPVGTPKNLYTSTALPTTNTITSDLFNLAAASSSSATQATLYFNTKYDTTRGN